MPAERGQHLQMSLGSTISVRTCMHGLMTSHAAVKDYVTPEGRGWIAKQNFLIID